MRLAILRHWSGLCRLLLLAAAAGMMAGCQPAQPELPRLFTASPQTRQAGPGAVHPASKYATLEQELRQHLAAKLPPANHPDFAMLAANRAMIQAALGDFSAASQNLLDSQAVMTGQVEGEKGRAAAAALGQEGAKVFKGECYEISMLNSLIGICQLALGDNETAAIGFRKALENDKMSKEDCRDDFTLAYWGLGMANLDTDMEAARQALGRCGNKSAEQATGENLVFVICLGRAPGKRLTGLYGEYDEIVPEGYEPRSAAVWVDGKPLGKSVKLVDLYQQAQGVPRTAKDVGQGVKGGAKFALAMVAGVVLGSSGQDLVESGWSVTADTRTCFMLPNEVHVLSAQAAPGPHTVRVKFHDQAGNELPRYEQVWHQVPAPQTGRRLVLIRSEFDRCNVQGPIAFTRINKVQAVKPKAPADASAFTTAKGKVLEVRLRASNLPGLKIGDPVKLCHFYRPTEQRFDANYHWRYQPMAYNRKGQPIGCPGNGLRMTDYDVGLAGEGKVVRIKGNTAWAQVASLTTGYSPKVDDMVTACRQDGRIWR